MGAVTALPSALKSLRITEGSLSRAMLLWVRLGTICRGSAGRVQRRARNCGTGCPGRGPGQREYVLACWARWFLLQQRQGAGASA